jgi:protein TonB
MFNRLVISGAKGIKTNKPWTVALSAIAQVVIVFVLILIPMIYTEALDPRLAAMSLVAPPAPPQPPPLPAVTKAVNVRIIRLNELEAPKFISNRISIVTNDPPVVYSTGDTGAPGGTDSNLIDILRNAAPSPPKPVPPQRIRVGGNVEAGARINSVTPEYPKIAQMARISGTVVLHAVIAKDGTIEQLEYVSGPPMLVKAAMDAVKQWRYRPYLLNGDPVEVETTINVDFSLGG